MTEQDTQIRKETLLQQFFDDDINEIEAGELLDLLRRNSKWSENAQAEFETEQLFRFQKDRQKTLSPTRLDELKATLEHALGNPQAKPSDFLTNWDETTFSNLVQLEKNAPILSTLERSTEKRSSLFRVWFGNSKSEMKPTGFERQHKLNSMKWRHVALFLLCLLVSGFVATAIYTELFPKKEKTEIASNNHFAVIDIAIGVVPSENGKGFKRGQQLYNDRIRFESGMIQLRFENDVRIVLEGPTDLQLNSTWKTICDLGKLSVFVPPSGKGFEVATPHLTVRDLGTEFVVDVSEKESAIHVVKGEVEMDWFGGERQFFSTGEAVRMNSAARKPTRFIAESGQFVSENKIRREFTTYMGKKQSAWEATSRRQQADSTLLFSLDRASIHGSRRVMGMLEELTALRFQSPKDYVDLSIAGEHRNLTLLAIVRLDDMKNFSNTLCIGDGILDGPGEFLWQVDQSGAIFFHIRDEKDIQRFETAPIIDRSQWKTWMFLAVVIDGEKGTVSHYLDGKKIVLFPWEASIPLRMNRGTVGNKRPDRNDRTARFWNGDIDTFRVFSRAFDEKEMLDLFHTLY